MITSSEADFIAEAEAGFSPDQLIFTGYGPGSLLLGLDVDVQRAIISRLDVNSPTPVEEQISAILRSALDALSATAA